MQRTKFDKRERGSRTPKKLDIIYGRPRSGLIVLDLHRIVVPKDYRDHVLEILHKAHCGESKTKMLAKQKFYWPTINNSIDQITHECAECRRLLPSQQKEPVKGDFSAQFPMSDVSSDLFSIGQSYYLVLVDRYSGFPFCAKLKNITAASVIKQLYTWFTDYGWPVTMKSDQGTQGFLTQDLFHPTSLATWGSSGASKEAKFFKELTFLSFVCYFSTKIEET